MSKYTIFATTDNGNGYVTKLEGVDDLSDLEIRVGAFNDDVVITIEETGEDL